MKNLFKFILPIAILICSISYAQEIHNQSNALSYANEANSTEGWVGVSSGTSISSESTEAYHGQYCLKILAETDGWRRADYNFDTEVGARYKITIFAKRGTDVRQGFYIWDGFSDFVGKEIDTTEWKEYSWVLTASGTTATIKAFTGHASVAGNILYLDNVSIIKEDLISPTPPSLSSTSQTVSSVTLSWNGATDNVGITGYKVYKNGSLEIILEGNLNTYEVSNLTTGLTYQFTITSVDAYGNESVLSNQVSATITNENSESLWVSMGNNINYTAGNVGIGTNALTNYGLAVDDKIRAREIRVDNDNWADYVFKKDYNLPTLEEVQKHIQEKGHLPNIPSAKEVKANGIELGEMNKLLLEKIEELTLYTLKQEKKINNQQQINKKLLNRLEKIELIMIKKDQKK